MKLNVAIIAFLASINLAFGHFGVVIPSKNIISDEGRAKLNITYKFTHPFEQMMMNMDKPNEAGVFINGKKTDLSNTLKEQKDDKNSFWQSEYEIKEPGLYVFYVDPKGYFEASEEKFIRHITKSVVNAYGYGQGWQEPLGLKAEIVPLTRPYGLYAGNLFSAKVLYKGKPAKNVMVEVEFMNDGKKLGAPSEDHTTQEVMTNELGEFSFVMPHAGWWGFAALIDDDEKMNKDGKEYPVELGGVLWIKADEYKK